MENEKGMASFSIRLGERGRKEEKRRSSGILKLRPLTDLDPNKQNEEKAQKTYRRVSFAKTTSVLEFFNDSPQNSQDSDMDTSTGLDQLLSGQIQTESVTISSTATVDVNVSMAGDRTVNQTFDMDMTDCLEASSSSVFSAPAAVLPSSVPRPGLPFDSPESPDGQELSRNLDSRSFLHRLMGASSHRLQMLAHAQDPVLDQRSLGSTHAQAPPSTACTLLFAEGEGEMELTAGMDGTECLTGRVDRSFAAPPPAAEGTGISMGGLVPGVQPTAEADSEEEEETGANLELTDCVESNLSFQPRQPLQTLARLTVPPLDSSPSDFIPGPPMPPQAVAGRDQSWMVTMEESALHHSTSLTDQSWATRNRDLTVTGEVTGQTWPITVLPTGPTARPHGARGLGDVTSALRARELASQTENRPPIPPAQSAASLRRGPAGPLLQGVENEKPLLDLSHRMQSARNAGNPPGGIAESTIIFGQNEPTEAMEMTACLSSVLLFPDKVAGNLPPPCSDAVGMPEERTIHFGLGADAAAMELTDCQTYTQVLPGLGTAATSERDEEMYAVNGGDEKTIYFGNDQNTAAMDMTENVTMPAEMSCNSAGIEEPRIVPHERMNDSKLHRVSSAVKAADCSRDLSVSFSRDNMNKSHSKGVKDGLHEGTLHFASEETAADMDVTDVSGCQPLILSPSKTEADRPDHRGTGSASVPGNGTVHFAPEQTAADMEMTEMNDSRPLVSSASTRMVHKPSHPAAGRSGDRTIHFVSDQTTADMELTEAGGGHPFVSSALNNSVQKPRPAAANVSPDRTIHFVSEQTTADMEMTEVNGSRSLVFSTSKTVTEKSTESASGMSIARERTIHFAMEETKADMELTEVNQSPWIVPSDANRMASGSDHLSASAVQAGGKGTAPFSLELTGADMEVTRVDDRQLLVLSALKETTGRNCRTTPSSHSVGERTIHFSLEQTAADMELTDCRTRTDFRPRLVEAADTVEVDPENASSVESAKDSVFLKGKVEGDENSDDEVVFTYVSREKKMGLGEGERAVPLPAQSSTSMPCALPVPPSAASGMDASRGQPAAGTRKNTEIQESPEKPERNENLGKSEPSTQVPPPPPSQKPVKRRSLALDCIARKVEESKAGQSDASALGLKRKVPTLDSVLTTLMAKTAKVTHSEGVEAASTESPSDAEGPLMPSSDLVSAGFPGQAGAPAELSCDGAKQPAAQNSRVPAACLGKLGGAPAENRGVSEPTSCLEAKMLETGIEKETGNRTALMEDMSVGTLADVELELCGGEGSSLEEDRSRLPSSSAPASSASNVSSSFLSQSFQRATTSSFLCNTAVDKPWQMEDFMEAMGLTFLSLLKAVKPRESSLAELARIPGDNLWEKLEAVTMVMTHCQAQQAALPRLEAAIAQCDAQRQQLERSVVQQEPQVFRLAKSAVESNDPMEFNKLKKAAVSLYGHCKLTAKKVWKDFQQELNLEYLSSLKDERGKLMQGVKEVADAEEDLYDDLKNVDQDLMAATEMLEELSKKVQSLPASEDILQLQQVSAQLQQEEEDYAECKKQSKQLERECEEVRGLLRQQNADYLELERQLAQPPRGELQTLQSRLLLLQDNLQLLQGVIPFRLEKLTESGAVVNFYDRLLQLTVLFDPHHSQSVSSISLLPRLPGDAEPWTRLGCDLVLGQLDGERLRQKYTHRKFLSTLLTEVSLVVAEGKVLSREVHRASLRHIVEVDKRRLTVHLWCRKTVQKVLLSVVLRPSDYPKKTLDWSVAVQMGSVSVTAIQKKLAAVPTGAGYLTRTLAAVQSLIS